MKLSIGIIFIAFAFTLASAYRDPEEALIDQHKYECFAELAIPMSDFEKYNGSKAPELALGHCYMKCLMAKEGVFDEKNGYNVDVLLKKIGIQPHKLSDEIRFRLNECSKIANKEENTCERAYIGFLCIKTIKF